MPRPKRERQRLGPHDEQWWQTIRESLTLPRDSLGSNRFLVDAGILKPEDLDGLTGAEAHDLVNELRLANEWYCEENPSVQKREAVRAERRGRYEREPEPPWEPGPGAASRQAERERALRGTDGPPILINRPTLRLIALDAIKALKAGRIGWYIELRHAIDPEKWIRNRALPKPKAKTSKPKQSKKRK